MVADNIGPRSAHPWLGQDFHVGLRATLARQGIQLRNQGRQVHHLGGLLGGTEAAIEVQVIDAFGQRTPTFALEVLADLVLHGIEHAVAVAALLGQGEGFSHGGRSEGEGRDYARLGVSSRAMAAHPNPLTPSKEEIALLEPFERLGLDRITLVSTPAQAREACAALIEHTVWGFDTESKPTFHKEQVSDGPHIVQLATPERAWVFQLHDADCRAEVSALLAHGGHIKAGFGLGDDTRRIVSKLGVQPAAVMELNAVFRARGYRKDMGVKAAVAVLFNRRFLKSKKAATSNWAAPCLSEAQLVYAANDAWAAARVYHALGLD